MKLAAKLLACGFLCSLALPAADVTGIWMAQLGPAEDIAFQFKANQTAITGTMFGDEFDVPVRDLKITGDAIEFTVTTTNYYNGEKVKFAYSGTLGEKEMKLTRERVEAPVTGKPPKEKDGKQTFTLKRLA